MSKQVQCILCGKPSGSRSNEGLIHLSNSLVFVSHGNYGSTVFDLEPGYLSIVICDECVVDKKDRIEYVVENRKTTISSESFDPDREQEEEYDER